METDDWAQRAGQEVCRYSTPALARHASGLELVGRESAVEQHDDEQTGDISK